MTLDGKELLYVVGGGSFILEGAEGERCAIDPDDIEALVAQLRESGPDNSEEAV